jgi:hypothetical protein
MTIFEKIKSFSIEEMAEFIRLMVDESEDAEVACYGCINYGTYHSDPANKGTNLYECEGCMNEDVGLDIVKWLNLDVCKDGGAEDV